MTKDKTTVAAGTSNEIAVKTRSGKASTGAKRRKLE